MSRMRKILIVLLTACVSVCISVAVAACSNKNGNNFPNYKNPVDSVIEPGESEDPDNFNGRYVIKVQSEGGLALNGVTVAFKKNGTTQVNGISRNGEITVNLVPDEYSLEVDPDSLPAGYYLPDNADFKTSAETGNVTISLPSKVISMTAPSNKVYSLGEVMYDFSYTAGVSGEKKQLSDLVANYKAVMINFWYVDCSPCRLEFPAIQEAYEAYSDKIAIVALNAKDTATAIKNFQLDEKSHPLYTFDMAYDSAAMESRFSVSAWPTTIMVDRYGVVAYWSTGNETSTGAWMSLFAKYTSDNYVTNPDPGDGNGGDTGQEYIAPGDDVEMPDYNAIMNADKGQIFGEGAGKITGISVETNENDADRSWPWVAGSDGKTSYLYASNEGTTPTFAIIYFEIALKSGDILSYDISYNTASSDAIYVILDSATRLKQYTGNSDGFITEQGIYVANRDVVISLSFTYIKVDNANDDKIENDYARLANFTVVNVNDITYPMDFARAAADYGVTLDSIELWDDGFYHVTSNDESLDGAILFVDLWTSTAWSYEHAGSSTFVTTDSGSTYPASLYYFSFWEFSNYLTNESSGVTYTYTDHSYYLNTSLDMQKYSENGYLPVTETLRSIMEDFCLVFKDTKFNVGNYYDGEWIEMCYVFEHHNGEHPDGEVCYKTSDPVKGLSTLDTIEAVENVANHVEIKYQNTEKYFTFTAPVSGVYKIYTNERSQSMDPALFIFRSQLETETGFRYFDSNYGNAEGEFDIVAYHYFDKDETVYMALCMSQPTETGEFDFYIEYVGETFAWLRTASNGTYNMVIDEEGNWTGETVYASVPWTIGDDGIYYTYTPDAKGEYTELGSKLYIEFLHRNFCDYSRSLYQLIEDGVFNLNNYFLPDYTSKMREYYNEAISKPEDDELYGFVEASAEIVQIIAKVLEYKTSDKDDLSTGLWTSVAYYYEYYGPQTNN